MSPRTGRPLSANARQQKVETRMTKEELEKLDYCCKITKMSRSGVIRAGIALIHANLHKLKEK